MLGSLADAYPQALMEKSDEGYLPLHLAAPGPSLGRAKFVFDLCPRALQERANDRSLPLHTAAEADVPLDVVYFLVRAWPTAVSRGSAFAQK